MIVLENLRWGSHYLSPVIKEQQQAKGFPHLFLIHSRDTNATHTFHFTLHYVLTQTTPPGRTPASSTDFPPGCCLLNVGLREYGMVSLLQLPIAHNRGTQGSCQDLEISVRSSQGQSFTIITRNSAHKRVYKTVAIKGVDLCFQDSSAWQ